MKSRSKRKKRQLKRVIKQSLKRPSKQAWLRFGVVALALVGSAAAVLVAWPSATVSLADGTAYPAQLRQDYSSTVRSARDFEARQRSAHSKIISDSEVEGQLSLVQLDTTSGNFAAAKADLKALKQSIANWNLELDGGTKPANGTPAPLAATIPVVSGLNLPILIYHYPPPDFDQQLDHLQQAGYTVITMDQASAGLHGAALPDKPVVITFDDGFAAQMTAFDSLKAHHMPATFYIITGGEASRWCIGAGRRYGDPLQPSTGCGDAYLNWDQIRALDASGLITIGGHTVNHLNLASLSDADQRFEIATGKQQLEAQLGHAVRHFAYPYGAYNAVSIETVQAAGYVTGVTTNDGSIQSDGSPYTLRRVRDAMALP